LEYIEYQGETDADDNGHNNGDDKSPHDGLPSEYQLTCSSLPSLPDKDAPFHRAIQRLGAIMSNLDTHRCSLNDKDKSECRSGLGGQNERAPRQSPRAFLIWEIWAKADICGQNTITATPRISPTAIISVARFGRLCGRLSLILVTSISRARLPI
jgi:hypothetical protein